MTDEFVTWTETDTETGESYPVQIPVALAQQIEDGLKHPERRVRRERPRRAIEDPTEQEMPIEVSENFRNGQARLDHLT